MLPLNISDAPSPKIPKKQVCLAIFLVLSGLVMVNEGLKHSSTPMVVLGAMAMLPGCWSNIIIIQTLRNVAGYSFSQLPNYESDNDIV